MFRRDPADPAPVNHVDPSGTNATVSRNANGTISITTSFHFHGGQAALGRSYINYASDQFARAFGSSVSLNVSVSSLGQNQYTFRRMNGGRTERVGGGLLGRGANIGFSNPHGMTGRAIVDGTMKDFSYTGAQVFLHEFLHLLGAEHHYTLTGPNNSILVPDRGWENSIMGGGGGTQIDSRTLDEIIRNDGTGVVGSFFARGGVFFGRNASTGRAMYHNGSGWQPIGNAPYNIRWAPNSGTGNYVASQTAFYVGLGGGGLLNNGGEGEHVVPSHLF